MVESSDIRDGSSERRMSRASVQAEPLSRAAMAVAGTDEADIIDGSVVAVDGVGNLARGRTTGLGADETERRRCSRPKGLS